MTINTTSNFLQTLITDYRSACAIIKILKRQDKDMNSVIVSDEIWNKILEGVKKSKYFGDNRAKYKVRWGGITRSLTIYGIQIRVRDGWYSTLPAPEN